MRFHKNIFRLNVGIKKWYYIGIHFYLKWKKSNFKFKAYVPFQADTDCHNFGNILGFSEVGTYILLHNEDGICIRIIIFTHLAYDLTVISMHIFLNIFDYIT